MIRNTQFRTKIGDIIIEERKDRASSNSSVNDGSPNWKNQLSAWLFDPSLPEGGEAAVKKEIPDLQPAPALPGQPRVLELGCGDGNWCMRFKKQNPNWLVDGIDDTNHWMCYHKDLVLRYAQVLS